MSKHQRCGNCDLYDEKEKLCRCPFVYSIPKDSLPLGVKLDRIKMDKSDGEGCKFWQLGRLSWK